MTIIERILNVIAPYDCIVCHKEGSILCAPCSEEVCLSIPSRCYRCRKLTSDFAVCDGCKKVSKLSNVWVRTEYLGISKRLVHEMKFKSNRQAARVMSDLMSEILPQLPQSTVIVPIPTASSRKRQRGYDHSKQIAQGLARHTALICDDVLIRFGQTRQVGNGREARLKQLSGSFCARKSVAGTTILLVDDVVTTGGTLEAAAAELKKSGAKKVYATTFTQK